MLMRQVRMKGQVLFDALFEDVGFPGGSNKCATVSHAARNLVGAPVWSEQ